MKKLVKLKRSKCVKLKCCTFTPNDTFRAIDLVWNWAHTKKDKKISDSGAFRTHESRPPKKITVAPPTELYDQMGAGRGKLRWKLAANEHVSEGVTNEV